MLKPKSITHEHSKKPEIPKLKLLGPLPRRPKGPVHHTANAVLQQNVPAEGFVRAVWQACAPNPSTSQLTAKLLGAQAWFGLGGVSGAEM